MLKCYLSIWEIFLLVGVYIILVQLVNEIGKVLVKGYSIFIRYWVDNLLLGLLAAVRNYFGQLVWLLIHIK